jgi:hypothetical protein
MECENEMNFATNSKKTCPNEHTHSTLFFIFYPLQNLYWKWILLWKRCLVKFYFFCNLSYTTTHVLCNSKINWKFNSQKLKIQFWCSFKNSDQFKILIGFHTHRHIYLSPLPTSKSSGGRCVCGGSSEDGKKAGVEQQQQLLVVLLLFPIL